MYQEHECYTLHTVRTASVMKQTQLRQVAGLGWF